jgi:hypothetical protein
MDRRYIRISEHQATYQDLFQWSVEEYPSPDMVGNSVFYRADSNLLNQRSYAQSQHLQHRSRRLAPYCQSKRSDVLHLSLYTLEILIAPMVRSELSNLCKVKQ